MNALRRWWRALFGPRREPEPSHPPHPHPTHPSQPIGAVIDPHALDGALRRRGFQLDERSHWQRGELHLSVEIGDGGLRVGIWLHLARRAEVPADAAAAQKLAVESLRDGTLDTRPGTRPVQLHFTVQPGEDDALDRAIGIVEALRERVATS